jgi:Rieske Fe-S protein
VRGRVLIVLTVVVIVLVGFATLSALRGDHPSRHGTTVNLATLAPGHALPVNVTLPGARHTQARVFLVHPRGHPVMALLGISTHLGCRLLIRGDSMFGEGFTREDEFAFEDPCGGSVYALDGRCIGGPCPRDLDRYDVKLADNSATFDLHHLVRGPQRGSS